MLRRRTQSLEKLVEGPFFGVSMQGAILIATDLGAAAVNVSGRWHRIDLSTHVPSVLRCACVDSRARCWIGGQGGVACVDRTTIKEFGPAHGVPRRPISQIYEDFSDRVWVSSCGDHVAWFDLERWHRVTVQQGLCHHDVNGFAEDGKRRLWIGSSRGLSIVMANRVVQASIVDHLAGLNVKSIAGDSSGRLFLGIMGGLWVVHPDLELTRMSSEDGLPQATPEATLVDRLGRIWVGTWGGGIIQIDNLTSQVTGRQGLPEGGMIGSICEDLRGTIWAASLTNGLWNLEQHSASWQHVSTPIGFDAIRVVAAISQDAAMRLASW